VSMNQGGGFGCRPFLLCGASLLAERRALSG